MSLLETVVLVVVVVNLGSCPPVNVVEFLIPFLLKYKFDSNFSLGFYPCSF
jgi:hypothetical protein